jgi:hypothetical protein
VPGNGSLVAALATALGGRRPDLVVGKPAPALLTEAARLRGAQRVLVVGDRLDTDIEGAANAGMASLLVLTGVSTPADLLRAPEHQRPSHVAADCAALSAPEEASRVPEWRDGAAAHVGWRATHEDHRVVLAAEGGAGDPVDALRVLAGAAWQCPEWTQIRPADPAAEQALSTLRLA